VSEGHATVTGCALRWDPRDICVGLLSVLTVCREPNKRAGGFNRPSFFSYGQGCLLTGGCGWLCVLAGPVGVPGGAARRARAVAAHPAAAAERAEAGCESFAFVCACVWWWWRWEGGIGTCVFSPQAASVILWEHPAVRGNTRVQRPGWRGRKEWCGELLCPHTERL
jgi:hypothetical protein